MIPEMSHWERVRAALKGEETDRVPISPWRHWPVEDEIPQDLAAATLRWQRDHDFDLVANYPADALNWHDRITWPSLKEAGEHFSGLLVGGINEWQTLLQGPPAAIQAEIQDAIAQTGSQRYMVGPGCVLPINTPPPHIRAAKEAVGRF